MGYNRNSNSNNLQQELVRGKESETVFSNFINAIKSPITKEKYSYYFLKYVEYLEIGGMDRVSDLLKEDIRIIESQVISYIMKMRDEGYSYGSINTRLASIFLFYEMNDIVLNRKKISRYKGENIKTVKDRAYTREEIKCIIDGCDLKYKVVVSLMVSTGCRIGAIPDLKLSALNYLEEYELHQVTFYEDSKRSAYYSFTTPECSNYIMEYLEYRKRHGEKLGPASPLIRDDFTMGDLLHIENPRHLSLIAFQMSIRKVLIETGLRTITPIVKDESDKTGWKKLRRQVSQNHGIRKFTHTTMANSKINIEIREMLLGHSIGLSDAYYRPTVEQCLSEYLKVVDHLTINEENRLNKKVQEMQEKDDYKNYIIDKKIKTLEDVITQIVEKFERIDGIKKADRKLWELGMPDDKIDLYTQNGRDRRELEKQIQEDILKHKKNLVLGDS